MDTYGNSVRAGIELSNSIFGHEVLSYCWIHYIMYMILGLLFLIGSVVLYRTSKKIEDPDGKFAVYVGTIILGIISGLFWCNSTLNLLKLMVSPNVAVYDYCK